MPQGAELPPQPDLPSESIIDPAHYSLPELKALVERQQVELHALKHELERRQHTEEAHLRIVLENMPVMLLAIDDEGSCIAWNRESERVTGYTAKEVLGLKQELLEKLYPDADYRYLLDQFWRENRGSYRNLVLELTAKDGTPRYVSWADISSHFSVPGWKYWALGVDVTERQLSEEHSAILQEITAAFSKAMTAEEVANVVIQKITAVLGGHIGIVTLLNEQEQTVQIISGVTGLLREQFQALPLSFKSPITDAIRTGEPVWIESLQEYHARYPELARQVQESSLSRSIAAIPMYFSNRIRGGIGMTYQEDHTFSPEERQLIVSLAHQCAQTIERARLYEAEREQRNLAEALRETAMALNHSLTLSDVLDQILESLHRVVPHDAANIMLIEGDTAKVVRSRGHVQVGAAHPDDDPPQSFLIDQVATLQTMQVSQQPFVIPNTAEFPDWVQTTRQVNSYAGVPIVIRGQVAGFLNVNSRSPNFFADGHTERLQIFAAQAATAIQNAQLYEKAQQFAVFEERQRLARDLHDAVSQTLFSSSIIAEALARSKTIARQEEMAAHLFQLQRLNRGALAEMRSLLLELRTTRLSDIKVSHLLTQLAQAVMGRTDLEIKVGITGREKYPEAVHEMFYRVAQEALNNVAKHARATHVTLALTEEAGQVIFRVADNGTGFNPAEIDPNHMGLSIMRERARSAGAVFQINSAIGQGTEVLVQWQISEP